MWKANFEMVLVNFVVVLGVSVAHNHEFVVRMNIEVANALGRIQGVMSRL
jgi:hypothetical protein